jgi:SAM-dependent methyltransferase
MAFERIPEPELMDDAEQVDAYASADWSESHDRLMRQILDHFPRASIKGLFLNLGCGSGDDTFRFLRDYPDTRVTAIDGASRMVERAKQDLHTRFPQYQGRVEFHVAYIPSADIPIKDYAGVISNSLLHHFHEPGAFWTAVRQHSRAGSRIFVGDLRRPVSLEAVDDLVNTYAADAPGVLQEDFRNSLRAAFTLEEVQAQLQRAGLGELKVQAVGDRHLIIAGTRGAS